MWAPNNWVITSGNEAKLVAHLFDVDGSPLNISGASAVKLGFKRADESYFEKQAESGFSWGEPMDILFVYGFTLSSEETALLPIRDKQKVLVKVCFGSNVRAYQLQGALSVRNVSL